MNSHGDILRRLSAYCGGDLEPAERQLVELHLAECPACRAELADLQTTLHLVRTTPEIDPPPWLAARVMARVREQQQKPGWLQRFFFPLHVKLPLEAVALLVVCFTGYYLTRTVETNLQQTRQQLQEMPVQPARTPAQSPTRVDTVEHSTTPPQPPVAPAATPKAAPRLESTPLQMPPNAPTEPAPTTYAPAPPANRDQYTGKPASMKAVPAAESSNRALDSASELKSKNSRSLEHQPEAASPAVAGRSAAAPAGLALPLSLVRLSMEDSSTAPALIREALLRSGGEIVEDPGSSGRRLKARIPTAQQKDLLDRLERLGRIVERPAPPPAGAHLLELTVQW